MGDVMEETKAEVQDRVVHIGRVVKVVKGGRRFSFNALVVAGDGAGKVGWGLGKANEVPEAIRKASAAARKSLKVVRLEAHTIPYEVNYRYSSSRVMMLPAKDGVGIIAGGALRPVMELSGISNVVTKCHGSTNPHNVIKAAFRCIEALRTPEEVLMRRGKSTETTETEETTEREA